MGSGGEEAMMFAVVWDYERFQQWGEANDRFGMISPVRRQRPSSMVDRRRLLEFCVEGEKMVVLVAPRTARGSHKQTNNRARI